MYESLYVGATDIESLCVISDWSGVASSGPVGGDPVSVPLRRGAYYVAGEREPYTWDLPLSVFGSDVSALHTKLSALSALLDTSRGAITLTRRMSYTAGNTEQEARSILPAGWQPIYTGTEAARLALAVTNLDGCWYAKTATTGGAGSITIPGDIPTANALVTISGGTNQKVSLAGSWVQWTGSSGAGVVIDCLNWTATQGGLDVSGYLTHAGAATPLLFLPGANAVTLTGGGSVALSVKGAWR